MPEMVDFDIPKRERLRTAYEQAIAAKQDQFQFEGNEYLVAYARYLLEYLDQQLGGHEPCATR